jgi:hypothetical protein
VLNPIISNKFGSYLTPTEPKYNIWKFARTQQRITSGTYRLQVQVEKEKKGSGAMGIGYFLLIGKFTSKSDPLGFHVGRSYMESFQG